MKNVDKKKVGAMLGRILMLASLVFIVVRILQYNIDITVLASPGVVIGLILAALVFGISIFLTAFNFRWLVKVLSGVHANKKLVVGIYCITNLYKYIPGNVMHFIGRNRLAIETENLSHAKVAFATVTDNVFLFIAAILISIICSFDYFLSFFRQASISHTIVIIIVVVVVIVFICLVVFRKRIEKWYRDYINSLKGFRFSDIARHLGICVLRLLVLAATYVATLALLGQYITPEMAPRILGLFVLSWVIGFAVPGAPGGLGIREAILLMFMSDTLSESLLITSTIIHRVVCVLGDILAYVISLIYLKIHPDT